MGLFSKKKEDTVDPSIPGVTTKMPLVPFKVLDTDIPFYRDQECTDQVIEARITILQALDPDDEIQELDIFPTTKTYEKGSYVTLAFDNKTLWEDCWFKDVETGEIQRAWRIHVAFIGEVISSEVIEEESERLAELEQRVEAKIAEIARSREEDATIN